MAVGMAMAQQMMNQTGGIMAQSTPGIAAPPPPPVAGGAARRAHDARAGRRRCSASASPTCMASLEAGDLKGKKIGTQWRVTRDAVNTFLKS